MHIVDQIFVAMGESTAIATAMGLPIQTVNSWKTSGNIPSWRRPPLLDAAKRGDCQLAPDLLAYLASADTAPRKAKAA